MPSNATLAIAVTQYTPANWHEMTGFLQSICCLSSQVVHICKFNKMFVVNHMLVILNHFWVTLSQLFHCWISCYLYGFPADCRSERVKLYNHNVKDVYLKPQHNLHKYLTDKSNGAVIGLLPNIISYLVLPIPCTTTPASRRWPSVATIATATTSTWFSRMLNWYPGGYNKRPSCKVIEQTFCCH